MKDILVYQYSRTNLLLNPQIVGGYESLMYDSKEICETIHLARKKGRLSRPDWSLNFELNIAARNGDLPEIDLASEEVIVAIPENLRERVMGSIAQRQETYRQFLTGLTSSKGKVIMDRKIKSRDQTITLLEMMVEPFDENRFDIVWYPHKNLQYALLELAITKKGVIPEVPLDINEYWEHLQATQSSI